MSKQVYEKIKFSSKVFIYKSPEWKNEGAIIEIMRNLKKHSIISFKYGKGNNVIRTYGEQYSHRLIGQNFNKKEDYIQNLNKFVQAVFIFNDTPNTFVENLITFCELHKKPLITFENYHYVFNNNQFKTAQEVLEEIENSQTLNQFANAFNDLFVVTEEPKETSMTNLEKCRILLNQRDKEIKEQNELHKIKIYDPNEKNTMKILYKHKKEHEKKNLVLPDDIHYPLDGSLNYANFIKKK
jgi:hypothetical protein